jgi:DNA replication protein DnaC
MSTPSDSSLERVRRHLVGLKMPRALETLQDTLSRIERGELSTLEAIEALLGEELTTRQSRRIKMALQTARLTTIKTLAGYDFSFQPSLDRQQILALAELNFVERHQVVHLLGPPGTGKSHLAVALGVEAVQGRPQRALQHARRSDRLAHSCQARAGLARARTLPLAATASSSSTRSATCPWVAAGATCSSSWSTPATRRRR